MIGADRRLAQQGQGSRRVRRVLWLVTALACVLVLWASTRTVSKTAQNRSPGAMPVAAPAAALAAGNANRWEGMDALKAEAKSNPAAARAWKLCLENPSWAISDCRLIAQKKLRIGFTAEQCVEAWGRPERTRRTRSAAGSSEVWVYPGENYLYFEDGVLSMADQ